jgi:integrase
VERDPKDIPTEDEIKAMLQVARPKERAYVLVAIHTLGRSISINNLRWSDVYDDHLILKTRKCKSSSLKKIRIPINDLLQQVLAGIPHEGEYVFMNKKTGKPYDYRDKLIPSLCRKANIKRYTLHRIRHFGASMLDSQGVPLSDIQELLGHEQATTTSIYLQNLKGSTIEAVKKLEGIR